MELTVAQKREINKKIFEMIIPITTENVLQMLVGFGTMALIGHIGAMSVSAVGLSSRITNLIWAFFKGISIATTIFVAQYYGAKEMEKIKKIIQHALISVIGIMAVLVPIILVFAENILSIFNPDQELLRMSTEFLRISILGLPFFMILIVINAGFQGIGNTKTPLKLSLIMNIINIGLGYILIFGVFGEPLGMKGAAITMAISQTIAGVLSLVLAFKSEKFLKSYRNLNFFKIEISKIAQIYRVGIPSAMETVMWQLATIVMTRTILIFGATSYAAHQLGLQAESVSFMPAQGFGIAATALIGQCLGEGQPELAKVYFKNIAKWGCVVAVGGASMLLLLPTQLMGLLTNDNQVIKLGAMYLILMGLTQVPQNMEKIMSGAMRGAGYTKIPMYVAVLGLWGIRVPFSLFVAYISDYGIVPMWMVIDIDVILRFMITFLIYKKKNIYSHNNLKM